MPIIETNGIRLAYEIQGKGHPLLLITGVGYCGWFWGKVVPKLAEHFQLITFDNRGAGDSSKPDGPYTVPMMAEDTAGLLGALRIEGAYVMGHSLGGFIAQELAVTYPELVSKLILASTNHGGPNVIPITPQALEVLTNREGDPLALIRRGIDVACAPGFAKQQPNVVQDLIDYRLRNRVPPAQYSAQVMAGAGMGNLSEEIVLERMASIQVPVLLLFGEHDTVTPPGNAKLMAEKLSNAQVVILPGVGHIFPIEDPQATVEALVNFLKD